MKQGEAKIFPKQKFRLPSVVSTGPQSHLQELLLPEERLSLMRNHVVEVDLALHLAELAAYSR